MVLVTGASGGLGSGLTRELASRGARLALMARRPEPLEALAAEISGRGHTAVAVPGDITVASDRSRVVAEIEDLLGPVDILVNNAGIARAISYVDETPGDIVTTNLMGSMEMTRVVLPGMLERGRGHILTIASLAALGVPYIVDYSATKAGLVAFSTALREELAGTGVSTTVVSPGFIHDSGIYVDYETPVPWYMGSNRTAVIARKAVDAMVADRPEAILNRLPVRVMLVVKTASERLFRKITRTLGFNRYMANVAAEEVSRR